MPLPRGPAVLDENDRDLPHTLPSSISISPSSNFSKESPTLSSPMHEEHEERPDKPYFDGPLPKGSSRSETSTTQDFSSSLDYHGRDMPEILPILVGPMPPELFIVKFFPDQYPDDGMPAPHDAFSKVPVDAKRESQLYQPIVDALNTSFEGGAQRCPGITFCYTGDKDEQLENEDGQPENDDDHLEDEDEHLENKDTIKPNSKFEITGYKIQDPIVQGLPNTRNDAKAPFLPQHAELVITLKIHDIAKDPTSAEDNLEFRPRRGPNKKDLTHLALEELHSTATEVFSRQLRNFLFTLLMTPNEARFFRWDHAGVVMSASFDYRKDPGMLCRFLWQFGNASDAQRGWDAGVVRASAKEEALFKDRIELHVRSQLVDDFKDIEGEYKRHYEANNVVKLPVRHTTQDGVVDENFFLVSRPVARPRSMASRSTRGYWAMDLKTKEIVFLKDTWRTNNEDMEVEGDVLRSIEGVPNVPTLVCYGDVGDASSFDHAYITQTDRYRTAEWNAHRPVISKLTSRIHYRQVTKEAGYPLTNLAGSGELLRAVRDVYNALEAVYESAERMHRDISTGNIILFADDSTREYGNRRGILIDWELSCKIERDHARKHWKSGTWAFMSINTLGPDPGPHALVYDAESLVYVVFYCAIFFLKWSYSPATHKAIVADFFDQSTIREGDGNLLPIFKGGAGKTQNLYPVRFRGRTFAEPKGLPTVISHWLQRSVKFISQWYDSDPVDRIAEAQKKLASPIFDLSDNIFKDMPINDRECERPTLKGCSLLNLPATHTSATPPPSGELVAPSDVPASRARSRDTNPA
ncbi:hypothetical protein BDN70DRAFT_872007 [Pholiota conissans]|uniref:Fungal-type protein kinase domain-containing protein n=1 Tax=Pholiota conissans TaxID=109636 RepID=A0A9P6D6K9_9AGAR|nr:hypothetical protein BDN70DRAFT_872007 [Pholiota conissans]